MMAGIAYLRSRTTIEVLCRLFCAVRFKEKTLSPRVVLLLCRLCYRSTPRGESLYSSVLQRELILDVIRGDDDALLHRA